MGGRNRRMSWMGVLCLLRMVGMGWDGVWGGCEVEIVMDISWEEATCEVEANIIDQHNSCAYGAMLLDAQDRLQHRHAFSMLSILNHGQTAPVRQSPRFTSLS